MRLDAAMAAAGLDLAEVGERIGLNSSASRTLWRQGKSPQLDRWAQAAELLNVDPDWLLTGAGTPPARVAERLAWLLANPDLPPGLGPVKLSRRLLKQVEQDIESSGLDRYQQRR